MYTALKRLKVGHDDETDTPIYRTVGEPIPEADTWDWTVRTNYERAGYIRYEPSAAAVEHASPATRRKGDAK